MERIRWTSRKFQSGHPAGLLPVVLERLRGTLPHIREIIHPLGEPQLSFIPPNAWSLKQHIGHLSDLETLHEGRLDDFLQRNEILRAADMSNAKTNEATHNEKPISDLLSQFQQVRNHFIGQLQQLDQETLQFESLHPRLQIKMNPVDIAVFVAEHDDQHLAIMRELLLQV